MAKTVSLQLVIDSRGAVTGAAVFNAEIDKVKAKTASAGKSINTMGGQMNRLGQIARTVGLSIGTAFGALQFVQVVDKMKLLENRMRIVTRTTGELALVQRELSELSLRTRSDLITNSDLFARLALSTKGQGVATRELLNLTESLNQAIVLSGATSREAEAGLIQLSQGLASGTLRGDELRSVLEQLPAVADVISRSLGVTRGRLREMGTEGVITAQVVLDAFKKLGPELEQQFLTTIPTVGQTLVNLKTTAINLAVEFDKASGSTKTLISSIKFVQNITESLTKNIGILTTAVDVATVAIVVMTLRGIVLAVVQLKLMVASTAAAATGFRGLTAALFGAKRGFQALIASTGIGLLLVVLIELLPRIVKLITGFDIFGESADLMGKKVENLIDVVEKQSDVFELYKKSSERFRKAVEANSGPLAGMTTEVEVLGARVESLQDKLEAISINKIKPTLNVNELISQLTTAEAVASANIFGAGGKEFLSLSEFTVVINSEIKASLAAMKELNKEIKENPAESMAEAVRNMRASVDIAVERLKELSSIDFEIPFEDPFGPGNALSGNIDELRAGAVGMAEGFKEAFEIVESQVKVLGSVDTSSSRAEIDAFEERLSVLKDSLTALQSIDTRNEVTGPIFAAITAVTGFEDIVAKILASLDNAENEAKKAGERAAKAFLNGIEKIKEFGDNLSFDINTANLSDAENEDARLRAKIIKDANDIEATNLVQLIELYKNLDEALAKIDDRRDILNEVTIDEAIASINAETEAIRAKNTESERDVAFAREVASLEKAIGEITPEDLERLKKANDLRFDEKDAVKAIVDAEKERLRIEKERKELESSITGKIESMKQELAVLRLLNAGKKEEAALQEVLNSLDITKSQLSEQQLVQIESLIEKTKEETEVAEESAKKKREIEELNARIGAAFATAFEDAILGAKSFKEAAEDLIQTLIQLAFRQLVINNLMNAFSSFRLGGRGTPPTTPGLEGLNTGLPGGTVNSAQGNAFSNGRVIPFARGGLINDTAIFPLAGGNIGVAGEAGVEATLPLTRGRNGDLMVNAKGGGGQNINVTFNMPNIRTVDDFAKSRRQLQTEANRIFQRS